MSVTIIGCGSIGSYAGITLAKLGIRDFTLYDGDEVEAHNLSNQYYTKDDIGKIKSVALSDKIMQYSPYPHRVRCNYCSFFQENSILNSKIVIVCTDNIESRRLVYEQWKKNIFTEYLIDARMGGELMHIYCIDKNSNLSIIEQYEKSLEIDNQELPCSARTIVYNISVIGGLISNLVKKYCNSEDTPYHIVFHLNTLELIVNWNIEE